MKNKEIKKLTDDQLKNQINSLKKDLNNTKRKEIGDATTNKNKI